MDDGEGRIVTVQVDPLDRQADERRL